MLHLVLLISFVCKIMVQTHSVTPPSLILITLNLLRMHAHWSNAHIFCVQESINRSLMNLLTYPWIKEKVNDGELLIHGGYYDFIDCSFEKWTLENSSQVSIRNREFWSWVILPSPLFVLLYHFACNPNLSLLFLLTKWMLYKVWTIFATCIEEDDSFLYSTCSTSIFFGLHLWNYVVIVVRVHWSLGNRKFVCS